MTSKEKTNPIQKTARLAGFWYLLLGIFGSFGLLYIPALSVPGDAVATANNVMANESLFRLAFVSSLISQVLFIPLVLVLYKLLKSVNKTSAVYMVALALVSIPIGMLNQLNQAAALLLLSGADYLSIFSVDQLQSSAMFFLELSQQGFFIVQLFWGLWLLPFGYLVFKSGFLPRILGILLVITCVGYVIDFSTFFLFPDFSLTMGDVTGYGEVFIILWLLIMGVNVKEVEKRALAAAEIE